MKEAIYRLFSFMGRGGGIGRHAGLKILFHSNEVRVRFPPAVQAGKGFQETGTLYFFS
jgi:hypothetical protein